MYIIIIICMAKCLYSYGDDLPKSLFKITAQVCRKSGGSTPIHHLYRYVPPNGVVILKLMI